MEERDYEFGLDSFMAVTVGLDGEPIGGDEVKNCARVQFEHGECVATRVARPALNMHKTGPTQALLSETLDYRLTSKTNPRGCCWPSCPGD